MIGRILYGALFVVVLPSVLALWAHFLEPLVTLSIPWHPAIGAALLGLGLALIGLGTVALWIHGGDLPMNAYPPPILVERGIYRYFSQPMYLGFVIACAGTSITAGLPAGFWVVTPLVAAGCAALVFGHERHDLRRRFGRLPRPLVRLAPDTQDVPDCWERTSVYLLLFVPWLVLYGVIGLVQPQDVVETYFPFERGLPIVLWTEVVYVLAYPFVTLAPLVAGTRAVLRRFTIAGMTATALGMLAYVALPLITPPRPFDATGLLANLERLTRAATPHGTVACPSFHIAWSLLAAWVFAQRWPRWRWAWRALAAAMAGSCVTTGTHSIADVLAGLLLAALAYWAPVLWIHLVEAAEVVANSWHEWHVGPVRLINHGIYAGLAGLVGAIGAGILAGPKQVPFLVLAAVTAALGAALVGQLLVGSPTLLRPYGYYGSVLGTAAGLALAAALGADFWRLAMAVTVMAPWVQLVGRCRCLVQGCCHGAPTLTGWGIRYWRPESRVCRIAQLKGVLVYPTPLFSMLGNAVIGLLVARLWHAGAPPCVIVGLYLVLAGMARFVEESYRGEPQTPILRGLRLYQWFALGSVLTGAILMCAQTTSSVTAAEPSWPALAAGVLVGLAWWLAMGVDFPASNRRFARLA